MWKNNKVSAVCDMIDENITKNSFLKVLVIWITFVLSVSLLKLFFNFLDASREERMTWKRDYMYCNDCSNPTSLSCVSLEYEREDLKDDLCSIQRHNGQYRKTLYKSPAFEEYESKGKNKVFRN